MSKFGTALKIWDLTQKALYIRHECNRAKYEIEPILEKMCQAYDIKEKTLDVLENGFTHDDYQLAVRYAMQKAKQKASDAVWRSYVKARKQHKKNK